LTARVALRSLEKSWHRGQDKRGEERATWAWRGVPGRETEAPLGLALSSGTETTRLATASDRPTRRVSQSPDVPSRDASRLLTLGGTGFFGRGAQRDNRWMTLGDPSAGYQRGARGSRSRWLTPRETTCCVALVVVAILAGCGGGSDPTAPSTEDVIKRAAIVSPTSLGWNWPTVPTSSSPYSKNQGGDPPGDKRSATLYRQLRRLDLIGSAGSRWQDESKLAHLVVERFGSPADAHSAMRPYREFAHGWAEQTGAVSDEAVGGLGDEAWRISARGYTEEVTYKWRRADLVLEAHIQCLSSCESDINEAARAWVDAIDEEARRPSS